MMFFKKSKIRKQKRLDFQLYKDAFNIGFEKALKSAGQDFGEETGKKQAERFAVLKKEET